MRDCGQPHLDLVAELHRISRAHYHRAVRSILKNRNLIKSEKMADAIADNRTRDLVKEARKIKSRYNFKPTNVDGCSGDDEISKLFCNKFNNLYNSVPYNKQEMDVIKKKYNLNVDNCINNLSVNDVKKAINRLKFDKLDGEEGLNSDHVIDGHHLLIVLLTNICNCMLIHGVCPECMISGTMVSIPKGMRKSL